ncbi:hypothetical protein [Bosea sp. BIWAKO-01]|uniref:hypothetical protein n=1 Tax=Bosea sp. BIWAKO-01 TaxID=506668 RepID=UPI00114CCB38|nr:hypothetical protein [Bosea sp. BIWAKO-01]
MLATFSAQHATCLIRNVSLRMGTASNGANATPNIQYVEISNHALITPRATQPTRLGSSFGGGSGGIGKIKDGDQQLPERKMNIASIIPLANVYAHDL